MTPVEIPPRLALMLAIQRAEREHTRHFAEGLAEFLRGYLATEARIESLAPTLLSAKPKIDLTLARK